MTRILHDNTWLIPVAFPLVWLAASAAVSMMGGWWALSDRYATSEPAPLSQKWMVSGALGWTSYNNVLIVGQSEAGLRLSVFPLFRFCHPPLLIPWSEIRCIERTQSLFISSDVLEVTGDRAVRIRLPISVTQAFEHRWAR